MNENRMMEMILALDNLISEMKFIFVVLSFAKQVLYCLGLTSNEMKIF
jgi:hypothetical protein